MAKAYDTLMLHKLCKLHGVDINKHHTETAGPLPSPTGRLPLGDTHIGHITVGEHNAQIAAYVASSLEGVGEVVTIMGGDMLHCDVLYEHDAIVIDEFGKLQWLDYKINDAVKDIDFSKIEARCAVDIGTQMHKMIEQAFGIPREAPKREKVRDWEQRDRKRKRK